MAGVEQIEAPVCPDDDAPLPTPGVPSCQQAAPIEDVACARRELELRPLAGENLLDALAEDMLGNELQFLDARWRRGRHNEHVLRGRSEW